MWSDRLQIVGGSQVVLKAEELDQVQGGLLEVNRGGRVDLKDDTPTETFPHGCETEED